MPHSHPVFPAAVCLSASLPSYRAILQRVVVLSAAPGVGDLSPALVELTDYVFHPRDKDGDDDASLVRRRAANSNSSAPTYSSR